VGFGEESLGTPLGSAGGPRDKIPANAGFRRLAIPPLLFTPPVERVANEGKLAVGVKHSAVTSSGFGFGSALSGRSGLNGIPTAGLGMR
jgi:hypothetical protein